MLLATTPCVQVDSGGWEAEVFIDDSQKLRKPRLPVCMDDPDMLFGALITPRPTLKVLQTETQQENVGGITCLFFVYFNTNSKFIFLSF